MIILGIDPSIRSGTGLAVVDTTPNRPRVIETSVIKLSTKELSEWDSNRREAYIAHVVSDWVRPLTFSAVAIEWPIEHNQVRAYKRADGTIGTRLPSSHGQWRLLGRLCERLEPLARVVPVTPGEAKAACGVPQNAKHKPVSEVQRITGHQLHKEFKYAQEAIADAIAIALAGSSKIELEYMRAL